MYYLKNICKIITLSSIIAFIGCAEHHPASIGVTNNEPRPCPLTPNCVTSVETGLPHYIMPFVYTSSREEAIKILKRILSAQDKATVVKSTDNYLHVEFRSKFFNFVDDVEFYFPLNEPLIHIRSAARLGYSDFGVNRKRLEHLRVLFNESPMDR